MTFTGVFAEPAIQVIGTVTVGHVLALILKVAVPTSLASFAGTENCTTRDSVAPAGTFKGFSHRWHPPPQERESAKPVVAWYRSRALGVIAFARSDLRLKLSP